MNPFKALFLLVFLIAITSSVNAHLIGGTGIESGLTHPLFGLDHLLAMVAVGVISTQFGGKSMWLVPGAFVFFMVFGGLLAINGIAFGFTENMIALSVLVLGVLIALSKKLPLPLAIVAVSLFALFHGHAHGEELPAIVSPVLYVAGFVFSTTTLHISGVIIGHFAKKTVLTTNALRLAGALTGVMGILFLIGL